METIQGKMSLDMDLNKLQERLANSNRIILDLGTGDGKFAFHLADKVPDDFVIGVDSCRENLREQSRSKLKNLLFVIASAQNLPCELNGLISHITINFPWGSLLESLLTSDSRLICGLQSISSSIASADIRLNGGALTEAGWTLEDGAEQIHHNLLQAGWQINTPCFMDAYALRTFPTTWARRLAYGRDPRAITMRVALPIQQNVNIVDIPLK
ncbi:MAG: class I SAM-dependent methyltransferase [Anaerolineales bacterium]|nr:class I SAM-dependent methyltransferase [Anaerolineales bacterium]